MKAEDMSSTVLQARNLTKSYGSLKAVDDLSLEIQEGEIFGLLGPNGAGKTTSINMMCGLLQADQGDVLIHGRTISNGDAALRTRVGVCPQNIVLWGQLTCLEQMLFVGEMYGLRGPFLRERAEKLIADLDLADKRDCLARTLSGGMQRRLNLALGLVHDPEILVLDEPEAGLDPQSRVLVRDYIKAQSRRKTIILTTHNMDEADRMSDRVAIIDHGRLLILDTPDQLKRTLGEGDVLEIIIPSGSVSSALQAVRTIFPEAAAEGQSLVIRSHAVIDQLPSIMEKLYRAEVRPSDVHLRANSLEDVFIALTGRRLRE